LPSKNSLIKNAVNHRFDPVRLGLADSMKKRKKTLPILLKVQVETYVHETTSTYNSLTDSKWDCKYHVVVIPKCRKKQLYG